jgi:hypothetical protein
MPDIVTTLLGLGGEGATLRKGTVTAVSTGRLTVSVDGDVFTRVPYLIGAWTPAVDQQVYLLHQAGFGMLALGSPVLPTADPAPAAPTTLLVDPDLVANWTTNAAGTGGAWSGTLSDLVQSAGYRSSGAWIYAPADLAPWAATAIGMVEMELLVTSGSPQLALHRNVDLSEPLDTYNGPLPVSAPLGAATWVPLPVSWGRDLLSGEARGIVARSQSADAVLDLHGTLRFTSL